MGNEISDIKNGITGYSERGVMNAILHSIGDDKSEVENFLQTITKTKDLKINGDYYIYIEHSLSEFGGPDTIIIADNVVYFIEFKVCADTKSWKLEKQFKNFTDKYDASNIFYQLYLKKSLFDIRLSLTQDGWKDKYFKDKDGVVKSRKIGKHKLVNRLMEHIKSCETAKYIGIVPEATNTTTNNECKEFTFVGWADVEVLYKNNKIIKRNFDYNRDQIYFK